MRQLRFIAIGLVTFLFVTSAVFLRKIIAVFLCGVLSFNSAICYSSLDDYGEADAAVSSSKTILAQNPKPSEAKKPDPSNYDFFAIAKLGDVVDGRKIFLFDISQKAGLGYNALDDNGSVVYPIAKDNYGGGRQIIRDNKVVNSEGQKINNFIVKDVGDYIFCPNGNLDVKLYAVDPAGSRKHILTRNGKIIHIDDADKPDTPFPESYLSDDCNITNLYTYGKSARRSSTNISTSLFTANFLTHNLSSDFEIPYAKLLGLPQNTVLVTSLLWKADVNAKGDLLLLVTVVSPTAVFTTSTMDEKTGQQMLILVKPKSPQKPKPKKPNFEIALTKSTTTDSKSVTVDYTIKKTNDSDSGDISDSSEPNEPIHFEIYRAELNVITPNSRKILEQDISIQNSDKKYLSVGEHSIKLNLDKYLNPNTAFPFVVVQATYNGKKSETYFRKYLLGAIAHGFNRYDYFLLTRGIRYVGSLINEKTRIPDWEIRMSDKLKNIDKYDSVIEFNWGETCGLDQPKMAVNAGRALFKQILDSIATYRRDEGDVVDIHLIGHSRGTVVVTQALNDLVKYLPEVGLGGSYIELTLLDPHPANNELQKPWASFGKLALFLHMHTPNQPLPYGYGDDTRLLDIDPIESTESFQKGAVDPALDIPKGVKKIDVWYQMTHAEDLSEAPYQEDIMNLWGLVKTINNNSGVNIEFYDKTTGTKVRPAIGHNEIPSVYEKEVVETGNLNRSK